MVAEEAAFMVGIEEASAVGVEEVAEVELLQKSESSGKHPLISLCRLLPTILPFSRDPNAPLTPPDGQVMNIQNTYMKNAGGIGALGNLSLTPQFPPRPGHGTQGKKIAVYANYFKV
jgi:hypothetical protein